jgi:hypothetical protein
MLTVIWSFRLSKLSLWDVELRSRKLAPTSGDRPWDLRTLQVSRGCASNAPPKRGSLRERGAGPGNSLRVLVLWIYGQVCQCSRVDCFQTPVHRSQGSRRWGIDNRHTVSMYWPWYPVSNLSQLGLVYLTIIHDTTDFKFRFFSFTVVN